MSDKFYHHETRIARNAPPDAGSAGRFDVLEDEHGVYVSNADIGFMGRVDSVAEGIAEAERLADKYDAAHARLTYIECGCCGYLHLPEFMGDCRDDSNRFTFDQLNEKHGLGNYDYRDFENQMEDSE